MPNFNSNLAFTSGCNGVTQKLTITYIPSKINKTLVIKYTAAE